MNLELAKSLCGHDKDEMYVIQSKDDTYVYLVNGINKTVDKPKKKKQKHIQIVKQFPDEVESLLKEMTTLSNENAKRLIKIYLRSIQCQKQM